MCIINNLGLLVSSPQALHSTKIDKINITMHSFLMMSLIKSIIVPINLERIAKAVFSKQYRSAIIYLESSGISPAKLKIKLYKLIVTYFSF